MKQITLNTLTVRYNHNHQCFAAFPSVFYVVQYCFCVESHASVGATSQSFQGLSQSPWAGLNVDTDQPCLRTWGDTSSDDTDSQRF